MDQLIHDGQQIQKEASTKEGPLHSEELFLLLKTVILDEAPNHVMQFAQRSRDTADEEIVTPLETFVAAEHREPDLAAELDRADEAAEAEVDEDTPSPAQQRQLLRAHVNLGHPTIGEFCRALRNGRCRRGVVKCESRPMPRTRPAASLPKCYRFVASTQWKFGTRWIEKAQSEYPMPSVMGHVTTRAHAGRI